MTDALFVPEEPPKHWLGVPGDIVVTGAFQETQVALANLRHSGGIVLVEGATGLGKTFAVDLAGRKLGIDRRTIEMPGDPKGKETTARVHQALTGRQVAIRRITEYELLEDNLDLIRSQKLLLFIDEAQYLPRGSLRQLRYLFDQSDWLLLVLAGVSVSDRLQTSCPELDNRVSRRVRFRPYPAKTMMKVARAYHPIFHGATGDALHVCWQSAGGVFRNWAKILHAAVEDLALNPREGLDERTANLICRMTFGQKKQEIA